MHLQRLTGSQQQESNQKKRSVFQLSRTKKRFELLSHLKAPPFYKSEPISFRKALVAPFHPPWEAVCSSPLMTSNPAPSYNGFATSLPSTRRTTQDIFAISIFQLLFCRVLLGSFLSLLRPISSQYSFFSIPVLHTWRKWYRVTF